MVIFEIKNGSRRKYKIGFCLVIFTILLSISNENNFPFSFEKKNDMQKGIPPNILEENNIINRLENQPHNQDGVNRYNYSFSTYFGGSSDDIVYSIANDEEGNIYIAGNTQSSDLLTVNALNSTNNGGWDIFIAKLNSTGTGVIFSTYFGGSGSDSVLPNSLKIDSQGNIILVATTQSSNVPIVNALYDTYNGNYDLYIIKLNNTGTGLIFTTYLGGSDMDYCRGIDLDCDDNIYITGQTKSTNFPIKNAIEDSQNGDYDAFLTKISSSGDELIYSTFIGGSAEDAAFSIALDGNNNSYICGRTYSTNFPLLNPYDNLNDGACYDAFITKVNSTGNGLIFSTYLGGSYDDISYDLVLDSDNNVIIGGLTSSSGTFPLLNAIDSTIEMSEGFITKLNSTGNGLIEFSTFIGGSNNDGIYAIGKDASGKIYACGTTGSTDYPIKDGFDNSYKGAGDFVLTILNSNCSEILYSTYLGGSAAEDWCLELHVISEGNWLFCGSTTSNNLPLLNPVDSVCTSKEGYLIGYWCSTTPSLTNRPPISISGNSGFTEANGVTNGIGTQEDPYIIENWEILSTTSHGIQISSTTSYFVIRNCVIKGTYQSYAGIYLSNVVNGKIENTSLTCNRDGIYMVSGSSNNILDGCKIGDNTQRGLYTQSSSSNNIIRNSLVFNNSYYGIDFGDTSCQSNEVINCAIYANSRIGMSYVVGGYSGSHNTKIINNTIFSNYGGAITIGSSQNAIIENNTCYNNWGGISLDAADNCQIRRNTVADCQQGIVIAGPGSDYNTIEFNTVFYNDFVWMSGNSHHDNIIRNNNFYRNNIGIPVSSPAYNNKIYNNNIINNVQQASVPDSDNAWDYSNSGNYWSDYNGVDVDLNEIGDTPYSIGGGGGANDNFPLMKPANYFIYPDNNISAPVLNPINFSIEPNNRVHITWNSVPGASRYYIYRYNSSISTINSSVTPVGTTQKLEFDDYCPSNDDFYYVITATNATALSNLSNCRKTNEISINQILISSNSEFTAENGVTAGSGIQSDPFIIEGWNISASSADGIKIQNTNAYFIIRNCIIHDGGSNYKGINLYHAGNAVLENNSLSANQFGIAVEESPNVNISRNIVRSSFSSGITFSGSASANIRVYNNSVFDSVQDGLVIYKCSYGTVRYTHNLVSNCSRGIVFIDDFGDNYWVIEENLVTNCRTYGIYGDWTKSNNITRNIIMNTTGTGLYYSNGGNHKIWNNYFQNNTVHASFAAETGASLFDNGTIGNYWDDYSTKYPSATVTGNIWDTQYLVTGARYDRYPLSQFDVNWECDIFIYNGRPIINHPVDQISFEGTGSNTISWIINDTIIGSTNYNIYCNGTLNATGAWISGTPITINIDGRLIGYWNWTIIVSDGLGGIVTDEVWVHVIANTPPSIEAGGITSYVFGTTSNNIQWTITDSNTGTTSYSIYQNGSLNTTNSWISGIPIQFNVDGLYPGNYNFTLFASDGLGNITKNTVLLIVKNASIPSTFIKKIGGSLYIIDQIIIDKGFLYAPERGTASYISIFNITTGQLVGRFGTYGTNNGEFKDPIGIAINDSQYLFIGDTNNHRIQIFNPNSAFITPPTITEPENISFTENQLGYSITWMITDLTSNSSRSYTIYRNNSSILTNSWFPGDSIIVNIEGLTTGKWNFTIVVTDGMGGINKDEVWVEVITNEPPMIESSGITTYVFGTTENVINWTITDAANGTTSYSIYNNSILQKTGSWKSGSVLSYNVDGLEIGTYNFTIIATDGLGNITQNTVILTVTNPAPMITHPDDISYIENTPGHSISWTITDGTTNTGRNYVIYSNDIQIAMDMWTSESEITINVDGFTIGYWNVTIIASDGLGGIVRDELWVHVLANVPPSIEAGGVTSYVFGTTSNIIQWTITDLTAGTTGYSIYQNGSLNRTNSWSSGVPIQFNVDGLKYGVYNFTIVAVDGIGNTTQNTIILTVTNDVPQITTPSDQTWIHGTTGQSITWQVTDGANGTTSYVVWQNISTSYATGSWISGSNVVISLSGLSVGYHNFTIIAQDGLGSEATDEVWINVLPNDVPVIIGPADGSYFFGVTGNILEWNVVDPNIYSANYQLVRNGSIIASNIWSSGVNISQNIDGLSVGDYNYTLIVTDGYGGQAVDEVWMYVAPTTVPLITSPPDVTYALGSTGHTINWTIIDSTVDNPTFNITRNGVLINETSWASEIPIILSIDGLAIGTYEFIITATDGFGNIEQDSVNVSVNNTMPILTTPDDITYAIGSTGYYITWVVTDPNTAITSYTIYCNGLVNSTGSWSSGQEIIKFVNNLYLGTYNYTIVVQDGYGNSTADEVWVTVQNTLPIITHPVDITYNINTTGNSLTWAITDPDVASTHYTIYRNGSSITTNSWISGNAITMNIDGLAIGIYNYTIIANDGYDADISDEVLVVVQNTNPSISNPSDQVLPIGSLGKNITWIITDITVNVTAYTIYINGSVNATGTWNSGQTVMIGLDNLVVGIYNYTIIAMDGYGQEISDEVLIMVQNTNPTITQPQDINIAYEDRQLSVIWTITDPDTGNATYLLLINGTANITANWTSGVAVTYSLESLTVGTYNFTIIATDGFGLDIRDEVWVTIGNTIPVITQLADLILKYDERDHILAWRITDPNTNNASYTLKINGTIEAVMPWASGINVTYSLGAFEAGTYNITIQALDGYGAVVEDQVIVIIQIPIVIIPLSIHILTPANETVYRTAFDIPLNFETKGNGTFTKFWYQLNTEDWVEINGNTTINLFEPGVQNIQIKGLSDAEENITSTTHTFYLFIQTNPQAGLEVKASTTANNFNQGSMIQVTISIKNTGQVRLNTIYLRLQPYTNIYRIYSNAYIQVPSGLDPGQSYSYIMNVMVSRTSKTLNFTGNLNAEDLYVSVNFELNTSEDESVMNLSWPIGGASAAVGGVVIYSVYRSKKNKSNPGKGNEKGNGKSLPEPTMNDDVEFLL
jgi:parallel beta-helix repeat protein